MHPKKSNKKLASLWSTILTEPWYQKNLPLMLHTTSFGDIKAIYKNYLEPHLDHRYLNETLPYMNTTAENMVYWIFQTMSQELSDERGLRLEYVRLYETPTAFAEFRREWLDD